MPCSESSSRITLKLDREEKFISFDFVKMTCGKEVEKGSRYARYCAGKSLPEILQISFQGAVDDLGRHEEEDQFVLYLEWDALRSAIGQYLGIHDPEIDTDRSHIQLIEHNEGGIKITLVILPPKELPPLQPCRI